MTQRADLSNHVDEMLDRRLRDLIESHPTPLVLLNDEGHVLTLNKAAKDFELQWPSTLPLTQAHAGLVAGEAIPGYATQIGDTEAFLEVITIFFLFLAFGWFHNELLSQTLDFSFKFFHLFKIWTNY